LEKEVKIAVLRLKKAVFLPKKMQKFMKKIKYPAQNWKADKIRASSFHSQHRYKHRHP